MNDLLFYALLIALLYYFFIYLPQSKKLPIKKPFTTSHSSQTEPIINESDEELASTLDTLIQNLKQLNQSLN